MADIDPESTRPPPDQASSNGSGGSKAGRQHPRPWLDEPPLEAVEAVGAEESAMLPDIPTGLAEHFMLEYELGTGEYGIVYVGRSLRTGQRHAVKVVPKARQGRSLAENLERIALEIQIWRACQRSAYVISCDGVFQDADNVYLVQELCPGGDISVAMHGGGLSEHQAAEIMLAVLDVIAICHANDYVFGDIKPANFLLKQPLQRCPKLGPCAGKCASCLNVPRIDVRATDFGFSRRANCRQRHKMVGSPAYMAPELWQLNAEMTPKADVWAAGVMLYHLLSGRFPFWDAPADIVRRLPLHEVMVAVSSKPLVLDGPALSHVSRPARDLLMEMLDRNPHTRIGADEALQHRWLRRALGYTPEFSFSLSSSSSTDTSDWAVSPLGVRAAAPPSS